MNDLDRLLALATQEPAHGTAFYRLLLQSEVYVLVLEGERIAADGKIRFVMWQGQDGANVVPIFSNRAVVRRALRKGWEALRLRGRVVLEGCRGTTVVLNPNEALYCRLTSAEIANLLDTGSPDPSDSPALAAGDTVGLEEALDVPENLRRTFAEILGQFDDVDSGYLLKRHRHAMSSTWLVAVLMTTDNDAPIARRIEQLTKDDSFTRVVEFVRLLPDSDIAATVKARGAAFYTRHPSRGDRSVESRLH